ncbi:MAG TPA: hypothetical protein EYP36_12510 [Calditrichaeota bacterium]|nr:hypothetical protein [Calditrichota bacterium]
MTTKIITKSESKTDIAKETSIFAIGAISVLAALIGIWGLACLIGGLAANGPGGLIRGYITALTGM